MTLWWSLRFIYIVCKVIKKRYFAEKVAVFFQPTMHQNFYQVETPMTHRNSERLLRSKYLSLFKAPSVVLKGFFGVKTQIFLIAKLRQSVLQLSKDHL